MSGGGTNTNTIQQSNKPPPEYSGAYSNVLNQAVGAASQPYQWYQGQILAEPNQDQNNAVQLVRNAQGAAQPYIDQASQAIGASQTPIWGNVQQFSPGAVQNYMSPYISNVLDTAIAAQNNQDLQQQQGVVGNAISAGAWGGDRSAVAQGIMAGQQAIANNATNAGILNQGYSQALGEFNTQQQAQLGAQEAQNWLASQAGYGYANLGNEAQSTQLNFANALMGAGTWEQQQAQAPLTVQYNQWQAQQALPYQQAAWLQGIETNLGSSAGGTGTTTSPGASPWATGLGAAAAGVGILGQTGAFGSQGWLTGAGSAAGGAAAADAAATSAAMFGGFDAASLAGGAMSAGDAAALGALAFERGGSVGAGSSRGIVLPFPKSPMGPRGPSPTGRGIVGANDNRPIPSMPRPMVARGGRGIQAFDDGGDIQGFEGPPELGITAQAPPQQPTGAGIVSPPPRAQAPSTSDISGASPWKALTLAGLGIMGSGSPHIGEAIGRGALAGLKEFASEDEAAKRLSASVEEAKARLAETSAWHEGSLGARNASVDVRQQQADTAAQREQDQAAFNQAKLGYMNAGLDEKTANDRANADIRRMNAERALGQAEDMHNYRQSRLNQIDTAQSQRADAAAQTARLRQMGIDEATTANIMNNATKQVQADPTGKMTLQQAVDQQMGTRPHTQAQPQAAPQPPAAGLIPPPQGAIDYLKQHPETAPMFESHFGPGSSRQFLPGT